MTAFFPRDFRIDYPVVARARGIYVWDARGRRYIDASGGAVVVGIGHGVASIARAVAAQMRRISFTHTSQFHSQSALDLARALIRFAGKGYRNGRVYFCSGGSEAIETAVKLARAFHVERGDESRRIVISRTHSYHGATLACLTLGGIRSRRTPYEVMLDNEGRYGSKIPAAYCYRCPWNLRPDSCDVPCADELEKKIGEIGAEKVSAFLAEPVSGAALGAAVPSDLYWPRIREICDRHGILLIADEVMTGFGRLGRTLGLNRWKVEADLVAMGKGIASGYLPLAGVLARERIWKPIAEGSGRFEHGFTYHGHPVACAAGLAVLKELKRKKLTARAASLARYIERGLRSLQNKLPVMGDIRGGGLMWGIEFVQNPSTRAPFPAEFRFAEKVRAAAFRRGLILYSGSGFLEDGTGDHLMIAPPLIVSRKEIDEILRLFEVALREVMRSLEPTDDGRFSR